MKTIKTPEGYKKPKPKKLTVDHVAMEKRMGKKAHDKYMKSKS